MTIGRNILGVTLAFLAGAGTLRADEECDRSGYHGRVAWYALPSRTKAYTGYYVGGGQAIGGSSRGPNEGTWGWDYRGCLLPSRVALWFNHGAHYQGGGGPYKVDGHPLPDIPYQFDPAFKGRRLEK